MFLKKSWINSIKIASNVIKKITTPNVLAKLYFNDGNYQFVEYDSDVTCTCGEEFVLDLSSCSSNSR